MADDYRPAAILSVGVDSFDAIAARGEKTALRVLELVAGVLERRALDLGGTLRASSGPTFIAELPSALSAVRCGVDVSGALAQTTPLVTLSMGVDFGDVWLVGGEALGDVVEIARALREAAAPGTITVSRDVHRRVEGRVAGATRSLGSVEIRSLARSVDAFELKPPASGDGIPRAGETGPESGPGTEAAGSILDRWLAGRGPVLAAAVPAAIERFFPGLDGAPARPRGGEPRSEAEENEIEEEREAALQNSFRAHLGVFGAVSALLLVIWLVTSMPGHPWFLYPIGGWAIGIAHHAVANALRASHRRELRATLSAEQRRTLRRVHRAESGFAHHVTAFASVCGFLFMVNMITSPGFPWFLFPAAGWFAGLFSHRLFYRVRRRSLLERLRKLGVARGELAPARGASSSGGRLGLLVDEAGSIKDSLLRQIRGSESLRARLGPELMPLLERYVGQINGLNERSRELDTLLASLSEAQIDREIAGLEAGRDAARSAQVRSEYDHAIAQHRRQKESLEDLRGQQEILDLRIRGSVLALKRIEIDIARMKGLDTADVLGSLKEKSDDLSRYLDDLKAGYSELDP